MARRLCIWEKESRILCACDLDTLDGRPLLLHKYERGTGPFVLMVS